MHYLKQTWNSVVCVAFTFFVGSSWSLEKKKEMRWTANIFTDKKHHKKFSSYSLILSACMPGEHTILSTLLGVFFFFTFALSLSVAESTEQIPTSAPIQWLTASTIPFLQSFPLMCQIQACLVFSSQWLEWLFLNSGLKILGNSKIFEIQSHW